MERHRDRNRNKETGTEPQDSLQTGTARFRPTQLTERQWKTQAHEVEN